MTSSISGRDAPHVPDAAIVRALWPVLLAAVVGLFPFTVYSTFLVAIAETAEQSASLMGTLRGLGGVAALAVGVAIAPLIARWSAPHTTSVSLAILAVTSLVATVGTVHGLVIFCIGIGAATAVLTPTLLTIATDAFSGRSDAGRAATIVTATQSLAAVLAAPVIGAIGAWSGWRGALWVTAAVAALLAAYFLRPGAGRARAGARRVRYTEAFRRLRRRRDLLALVGIAFLRTTAFMGYLAFLAVHYDDRFALDPVVFTLVWTLSGASFFVGNYLAGRWARGPVRRRRGLLWGGLAGAAVAVIVVFTTNNLPVALVATTGMGFSHAIVAALVTTTIADRGGDLTPPAFSINAAGMSLGVFAGAVIAGVGLSVAGSLGMGISLLLPTLLAFVLVPTALSTTAE